MIQKDREKSLQRQHKLKLNLNFITDLDASCGSTRIRVLSLISPLSRYFNQVKINDSIFNSDIIIFQKCTPIKKVIRAHLLGKVCLLDIDDFFPNFVEMMKICDGIIVSTQSLRDKFKQYNKNIFVIQNCLDIDNYDIPLAKHEKQNVFGWYGWSQNSTILDELEIRRLVRVISDKGYDVKYDKDTIDSEIQKLDFVIIPQKNNDLTKCKTHCRLLKSLYLGTPCFFSDMPEYVSLANELNIPSYYLVKDLNRFKEIILNKKYSNAPILDFQHIRSIILSKYSNSIIAKEMVATLLHFWKERTPIKNILSNLIVKVEVCGHVKIFLLGVCVFSHKKLTIPPP